MIKVSQDLDYLPFQFLSCKTFNGNLMFWSSNFLIFDLTYCLSILSIFRFISSSNSKSFSLRQEHFLKKYSIFWLKSCKPVVSVFSYGCYRNKILHQKDCIQVALRYIPYHSHLCYTIK